MCCALSTPSLCPNPAAGQDTPGVSLPEEGAAAEPAHGNPPAPLGAAQPAPHKREEQNPYGEIKAGGALGIWQREIGSKVLPGWGAAAALLQAVLWEEGANVEAWLTPDPEECLWRQTPLEEAGGKLHHPAVPTLPS